MFLLVFLKSFGAFGIYPLLGWLIKFCPCLLLSGVMVQGDVTGSFLSASIPVKKALQMSALSPLHLAV